MRPYGADKYDTVSCKYGCCGGALNKYKRRKPACASLKTFTKRARKRARRNALKDVD